MKRKSNPSSHHNSIPYSHLRKRELDIFLEDIPVESGKFYLSLQSNLYNLFQVSSGRETLSACSSVNYDFRWRLLDQRKQVLKLVNHGLRKGVELLRLVEGEFPTGCSQLREQKWLVSCCHLTC